MLTALLVVLLFAASDPSAPAEQLAARTSGATVKLVNASGTVAASQQAVLVVSAPKSSDCHVTLAYHARDIAKSVAKNPGSSGDLEFAWTFPKRSPAGKWKATVDCAHPKAVLARTITLRAKPGHNNRTPHLTVRVIRVTASSPPGVVEPPALGGGPYPPYGSVILPGSDWFGGHGVNVYSNGSPGNDNGTYQCVELFERFINAEGWYHGIAGAGSWGAWQLFDNVPSSAFDKHPNGSGYIPVPGDAVIFSGLTYGHVAIVDSVGSGYVDLIEQNASPSGRNAIRISGSTLGNDGPYLSVIGVLHAKANSSPPASGGGPVGGGQGGAGASASGTGYETAFQANTGSLIEIGAGGNANTTQGMMAGTNPSIAALPGAGYEMAFQANTGSLIVYGTAADINTQQGMKAGTSPSIAASPHGGFEVAFQANNGNLYIYNSATGAANLQQGMDNNTSPSMAALPGGGYEIAFQANTGNLIVYGSAADTNTGQGMMAGTSPSIAASPNGGFQAAFEANTGNLYRYNSATGPANLQQGMDNETSPSIAALSSSGYEMAFQANSGNLIVYGDGGNGNTQQGMKAGTSPSIAAAPTGGFQVAFQANTGNLYTYNSTTGAANLQQGMDNLTSPSIAP